MWFRQEQRSLGRHERLPVSLDQTEDNRVTLSETVSASAPSQGETPSQEEAPNSSSSQSNSDLQPQERDEIQTENSSSDRTTDTAEIDMDIAGRPLPDDRAFLGDLEDNLEDEVDTSMELNQLLRSLSIRRRRLFICILILSLLLLRLYIEAIFSSDFALFWACLILTSWLMRWINSQRELLDGMERLWREDTRRSDDGDLEAMDAGSRRRQSRRRRNRQRTAAVDGEQELNYRMLSFQAQLSMAIMESQRHILVNGGFGRPDGDETEENRGVSEEAKQRWDQFEFSEDAAASKNLKSEDQLCCICLGEYENGDNLYVVPCGHAYHTDCIDSWCSSHVRCPLCNFDLEEGRNTVIDEECLPEADRLDGTASSSHLELIS